MNILNSSRSAPEQIEEPLASTNRRFGEILPGRDVVLSRGDYPQLLFLISLLFFRLEIDSGADLLILRRMEEAIADRPGA